MALIFANATFRGKYFRPQSGATIRRSGATNGTARRIRPATDSAVSISWVERSSTPKMIVFPGSFERTEESSDDCAVSIDICFTRHSASSGKNEYPDGRSLTKAAYPKQR